MTERRGVRMQSVVTPASTVELALAEGEVPRPGPDEVVVRVEAAPINPSDLAVMLAGADVGLAEAGGSEEWPVVRVPLSPGAMRAARARLDQPVPVGNEGAGTIVAAGSGQEARALSERVVSVAGGAMYSQFRCVKASACLPLPAGATAEDGAASFINPMTALGMVETMRMEGHRALVHTAAASSLGQMLNRLCIAEGVPLVNVVRSPAQRASLRDAGAEYVCDSNSDDFDDELTAALRATGATLAFDAVGGGALADRILAGMERAISDGGPYRTYGSAVRKQVYLYGSLDRSPTQLRRTYGMAWGIGGWLLTNFLESAGPERIARMRAKVVDGLTSIFASRFTHRVTLAGALRPEAIAAYGRPTTGIKYLILPNSVEAG